MKTGILTAAVALALDAAISFASQPVVIAHRGLWNVPGSAQNSIAALVKADSVGCDASEFDIWMTCDSVLVVNHDATYNGVSMEYSTSDVVCAQKLANGENLPTLREYLTAAKPLDIELIVEIKSHNSNSTERAAIRRTIDMVREMGLEDRVSYVLFSKNGILECIKYAPKGTSIQYPKGDYLPEQAKMIGITGIDYKITVLKEHPEWISRARDLGLTVGVWTITSAEDFQWCLDNGANFVTSNDPVLHMSMTDKNR